MKNYGNGMTNRSLGDSFNRMSANDKLIRLLMNSSILSTEQRTELTRIRSLTKSACGTKKNSEYINNCYKEHYEKNISLD